MVVILSSMQSVPTRLSPIQTEARVVKEIIVSRRRSLCLGACVLSSVFGLVSVGHSREALALDLDEVEKEEDRVVNIFQVSMPICVGLK